MTDIERIKKTLKKYSVTEAYLFGSYRDNPDQARDIDLAISLSDAKEFFKISAALATLVSKPLDLIYLDQKCRFNDYVKQEGLKIYG